MATIPHKAATDRPEDVATRLKAITNCLLKALVFELLAVVVDVIGVFLLIGATIAMATEDHFTGVTLFFGYLIDLVPLAFLAAGAVLSVVLAIRTWRMLRAANDGDVGELHTHSSLGWVAIAFVFSWVVPGVQLKRADRLIRQTST